MPGGVALHCVEYTRDVTLKEPEEELRKRNVSLVGPSGIGKTTRIKRILDQVGLRASGRVTI
jgi:putative ribosome biogenesis GTPase RsgA